MGRIAIFVDAGYLFAQGSVALTGAKRARVELQLNETAAIAELRDIAMSKADGCGLLRIYWYDGATHAKPSLEQEQVGNLDNVKLRLGFLNTSGQQKGVDSLIVTDLIDLARNHAISDAMLLSGDEDVRIGVQIAQQFGVRVHLLGIHPARGSQSKALMQEADTTSEWDREVISKFMSLKGVVGPAQPVRVPPTDSASTSSNLGAMDFEAAQASVIGDIIASLSHNAVQQLQSFWNTNSDIPPEYDRKMIALIRDQVGRRLDSAELRAARKAFKEAVRVVTPPP